MKATIEKRIYEFEGIRGFASILILLFHLPLWNKNLENNFINNCYLMVELFFVLSGFIISYKYLSKIETFKDLVQFQQLRFNRLYPLHFIFVMVFLLIETIKYIAAEQFNINSVNSIPFEKNNIIALIENLFLVQAIGPTGNATSFNGPAWSISVEFYTYMLFGLLIVIFKSYKIYAIVIVFLFSLFCIGFGYLQSYSELLRCTAGFFTGCITYMIVMNKRIKYYKYANLLITVALLNYLIVKNKYEFDICIYFYSALICAILFINSNKVGSSLFNNPILVWLGKRSYSIYMTQWSIIWIVNQIIRFLSNNKEVIIKNQSVPQIDIFYALISYFIVITLTVLLSNFTYNKFEKYKYIGRSK